MKLCEAYDIFSMYMLFRVAIIFQKTISVGRLNSQIIFLLQRLNISMTVEDEHINVIKSEMKVIIFVFCAQTLMHSVLWKTEN